MAVLASDLRILLTEQDVLNLLLSIVKFTSFTLITHQSFDWAVTKLPLLDAIPLLNDTGTFGC
jgi:hypothetical protein